MHGRPITRRATLQAALAFAGMAAGVTRSSAQGRAAGTPAPALSDVGVDFHTHLMKKAHLTEGGTFLTSLLRVGYPESIMYAEEERHYAHATTGLDPAKPDLQTVPHAARHTVVIAFAASYAGLHVPSAEVAAYVRAHNQRDPNHHWLVGFGSADPLSPTVHSQLAEIADLKLSGIKMGPVYQGVHALGPEMEPVYAFAAAQRLPILIHQGTTFIDNGNLNFTRPADLSEVTQRHPRLKMVIAHMGHPYMEECVSAIRMNPGLFADISALGFRRQQQYRTLSYIDEYGVWDKVIFGTDFPFRTVSETVEELLHINEIDETGERGGRAVGQRIIPEAKIRQMIERNTLERLEVPNV